MIQKKKAPCGCLLVSLYSGSDGTSSMVVVPIHSTTSCLTQLKSLQTLYCLDLWEALQSTFLRNLFTCSLANVQNSKVSSTVHSDHHRDGMVAQYVMEC